MHVDMMISVRYGYSIPKVTEQVQERVSQQIETMTGLTVSEVNVRVSGVNKSTGWKVGRLPKADLTVLRLAVYEIMFDENVPDNVAVNEAVELAKQYCGDSSPRYINGVLAAVVRERSNTDAETQ